MKQITVREFQRRYSTTDDRRNKRYTAEASISAMLVSDGRVDNWAPVPDQFPLSKLEEHIRRALAADPFEGAKVKGKKGAAKILSVDVSAPCGFQEHYSGKSGQQYAWINIDFLLKADKPSHLPDEVEAFYQIDLSFEEIEGWINDGISRVWTEKEERAALVKRIRAANHILNCLAKEVDEKARVAVRYEQRLAALKAELEAEKRYQTKAISEKMRADGDTWESGEQIDQTLLNAACDALPARMGRTDPPFYFADEQGYTSASHVNPAKV